MVGYCQLWKEALLSLPSCSISSVRLRGSRTGSGGGVLWREALVSCEVKGEGV